jgi:hypothetical protein
MVVTEQMEKPVDREQPQLCGRVVTSCLRLTGRHPNRDHDVPEKVFFRWRKQELAVGAGRRREGEHVCRLVRPGELPVEAADLEGGG